MKRLKKGGGKFPQDVARFFNPHKSGTNAQYTKEGMLIAFGTHQREKAQQSSCIPVYNAGGTARAIIKNGKKVYV